VAGAQRLAAGFIVGVVLAATLATAVTAAAEDGGFTVTRVISAPDGGRLWSNHVNVVRVHPDLRFAVGLRNDATSRKATVGLTITGGTGTTIVVWRAVSLVPHARATVRLDGFVGKIAFAQRQLLTVRLSDARHREVWVRSYPIIFALG